MFGQLLREEDLVRLERSLAMAPSLPGDAGRRMIAEIRRLRDEQLDTAQVVGALLQTFTREVLDALAVEDVTDGTEPSDQGKRSC